MKYNFAYKKKKYLLSNEYNNKTIEQNEIHFGL